MAVEEQRFDRLARTVGGQRTRREAMRWLGGSLAAVVALVRGGSAAAQGTTRSVVPVTTAVNVGLTAPVRFPVMTTATTTMAH
jgi:hypothetical protein